jgi:hypothetical protein
LYAWTAAQLRQAQGADPQPSITIGTSGFSLNCPDQLVFDPY